MGPRTGMDMVSKREIPSSSRESNPDHPIVQPVASRYADCSHLVRTYRNNPNYCGPIKRIQLNQTRSTVNKISGDLKYMLGKIRPLKGEELGGGRTYSKRHIHGDIK
jgi:hypothetical protein